MVSKSTHIYMSVFHITANEEKICLERTGGDFYPLACIHSLSLITITSLADIHLSEAYFLMQICNSFSLERQN